MLTPCNSDAMPEYPFGDMNQPGGMNQSESGMMPQNTNLYLSESSQRSDIYRHDAGMNQPNVGISQHSSGMSQPGGGNIYSMDDKKIPGEVIFENKKIFYNLLTRIHTQIVNSINFLIYMP